MVASAINLSHCNNEACMFLKWEGLSAPGRWLKLFLEAFPESIPGRRQPVVGETFKHNLCQKCKCFRYNRRQASFWTTGIIPISSKNPLTKEELLRILQPILFWSNFVSVALWKTMCSLCAVAHCYITMYIYKKKKHLKWIPRIMWQHTSYWNRLLVCTQLKCSVISMDFSDST